jgi:hypothetical protein
MAGVVGRSGRTEEWLTEVVGQDGIADGDVAGDTLVEAAVGEDAERRGEVLLAVEALILKVVELGVRSNAELLARFCLSQALDGWRVRLTVVADKCSFRLLGIGRQLCRCGSWKVCDRGRHIERFLICLWLRSRRFVTKYRLI